jgi:hypothetical protein
MQKGRMSSHCVHCPINQKDGIIHCLPLLLIFSIHRKASKESNMRFSMATVFSVTFSHALLLLLGGSGRVLPVTGSPLPRVVEPNNNSNSDGPPRSLVRIGNNKGSHGYVTALDESLPNSNLLLSLSGDEESKEEVSRTTPR